MYQNTASSFPPLCTEIMVNFIFTLPYILPIFINYNKYYVLNSFIIRKYALKREVIILFINYPKYLQLCKNF